MSPGQLLAWINTEPLTTDTLAALLGHLEVSPAWRLDGFGLDDEGVLSIDATHRASGDTIGLTFSPLAG